MQKRAKLSFPQEPDGFTLNFNQVSMSKSQLIILYIHQASIMPKKLVIPRSGMVVGGTSSLRSSSSSASSRFIVAVFESGKGSSQISSLPFFF